MKGLMKNRYLAKAIAKQCLYEFKRQIQYKCEKYGICEADNGILLQKCVPVVEALTKN